MFSFSVALALVLPFMPGDGGDSCSVERREIGLVVYMVGFAMCSVISGLRRTLGEGYEG